MATAVLEREPIAPREDEQAKLEAVRRAIFPTIDEATQEAELVGPHGERIALPKSLFRVLRQAVAALQRGEAVAVVPVHKELTTQQAADILNVSRQYLVQLLEKGEIPFTKVGRHRRIKYGELIRYKQQRDMARRQKLARLTQLSQKLGLYD